VVLSEGGQSRVKRLSNTGQTLVKHWSNSQMRGLNTGELMLLADLDDGQILAK
jgi:hypothetical protein